MSHPAEQQHTPGPWFEEDRAEHGIDILANGRNGIKHRIAHVVPWSSYCAGNASLIASAPDLLSQRDELLKALKAAALELPTTNAVMKQINAAIEKAEKQS